MSDRGTRNAVRRVELEGGAWIDVRTDRESVERAALLIDRANALASRLFAEALEAAVAAWSRPEAVTVAAALKIDAVDAAAVIAALTDEVERLGITKRESRAVRRAVLREARPREPRRNGRNGR